MVNSAERAARGAAWLAKRVERVLAEADLTLPQYRLLSLLETGGATATYAAERLAVSPPSVTAIVDGMVTKGLVQRAPVVEDRRRVELAITNDGHAVLTKADAMILERLGQLAASGDASLSPEQALAALVWWLDVIEAEMTAATEPQSVR
jgi:DNA-binding MarR family transcriptional regulator